MQAAQAEHNYQRKELARQLRERGANLRLVGIIVCVVGAAITGVGYMGAAEHGGTFFFWHGAILGGLAMAARGQGLIKESRRFED
jgi:hypothetical protein